MKITYSFVIAILIHSIAGIAFAGIASAGDKEPIILKHDGWVAALAFSPDGKTLASAGADKVVRLWEVGSWKPKGVLKGHTDCVCALSFDDSGRWLGTGSYDQTAKVWDMRGLNENSTVKPQKGVVLAVLAGNIMSPVLVVGGVDGTVRVFPKVVERMLDENNVKLPKHKSWVNSLASHEKGGMATGSSDGTVCLASREKDATKQVFFEGGAGEVRCVAFSPDGKLLAAGNRYGTVRIWDTATRKEVKTITGLMSDVWSIAFSPDGKTLAAVDTDWKKPSKIKFYDTATWQERGSLPMPGEILCLAYSPDGAWLAAGSWDKTVRIFAVGKQP